MRRSACSIAAMFALFACTGVYAMEKPLLTLSKKTQPAGELVVADQVVRTPAYDFGEIVLFNRLGEKVELTFNIGPDQMFTPIVRHVTGEIISNGKPFGYSRAPWSEVRAVAVPANQSFTAEARKLLETVPEERQVPGVYYVRVRYERGGVTWESNEIEITLK